jgi:DNA polymerase-3 subunit beta
MSLSSRLVEGRYPEYERAIPNDLEHVYRMETESLLVGLRQASLMTTKETNSVRFGFRPDGIVLSTAASNVGESRIEVPAKQEQGDEEEFSIHFNPGYVIDLLRVLDSPQVICSFRDRKTAGLFSLPEGGPTYRHIVMPLVVQEGVGEPV